MTPGKFTEHLPQS